MSDTKPKPTVADLNRKLAYKQRHIVRLEEALASAAGKLAVVRLLIAASPSERLAQEIKKHLGDL